MTCGDRCWFGSGVGSTGSIRSNALCIAVVELRSLLARRELIRVCSRRRRRQPHVRRRLNAGSLLALGPVPLATPSINRLTSPPSSPSIDYTYQSADPMNLHFAPPNSARAHRAGSEHQSKGGYCCCAAAVCPCTYVPLVIMRPFSTTALQILLLLLPVMATAFFVPARLAPQYKGALPHEMHTMKSGPTCRWNHTRCTHAFDPS